ncbi:hypothetical protein [Nonomuraea sp. NPDC052265]|uniref:hypothetical protein n=1 Tax=Nonomuraea sp. NPDC052265 TaxID=3364374 RepID=UPI0037CC2F6C
MTSTTEASVTTVIASPATARANGTMMCHRRSCARSDRNPFTSSATMPHALGTAVSQPMAPVPPLPPPEGWSAASGR